MRRTTAPHPQHPRALATTLLLVLTTGLLVACGNDEDLGAIRPGSVVVARSEIEPTEERAKVLLPSGELVVRSGEPIEELIADQTRDHLPVSAPEGGTFIPLRWTYDTSVFEEMQPVFGEPQELSMTLVAGEQKYGLSPPRPDIDSKSTTDVYVAVAGDPETLEVAVDYAGVRWTVKLATGKVETRRGKLLAKTAEFRANRTHKCLTDQNGFIFDDTLATFDCTHSEPFLTPYLDGKFAREGFAFLVMQITTHLAAVVVAGDGGNARYAVESSKDHTKLGDKHAIKLLGETVQAGVTQAFWVWRVEIERNGTVEKLPEKIHYERNYKLRLEQVTGDIDPRSRRTLKIEGDIPLEL